MKSLPAMIFVVLIIQAFFAFLIFKLIPKFPERGQFGDLFGAVNSLFSGLAVAGLLNTIHLQREDLKLQRDSLKETKLELEKSTKAQEESEKALNAQAKATERYSKLSTISFLLEYYEEKLSEPGIKHQTIKSTEIRTKKEELLRVLDSMHDELKEK